MEKIILFVKANKVAFIVGGLILLGIILYFVFGNDDDNEGADKPGDSGCPSSFTIKPTGGIQSLVSTTYSVLDGKYFKQVSGGAFGASGSLPKREISKEEFMAACKTYQTPATGDLPNASGGMMQRGGVVSSDSSNVLYNKNGNPVNPSNRSAKVCAVECLIPYPKGSQYYGYYHCTTGKVKGGWCGYPDKD